MFKLGNLTICASIVFLCLATAVTSTVYAENNTPVATNSQAVTSLPLQGSILHNKVSTSADVSSHGRILTAPVVKKKNILEKIIFEIMDYTVYFSQIMATFVIIVGMIKALRTFIKDAILGGESIKAIRESRIELGHSFSLGLGLLIGASILKTTAAPNWDDIGKLSVIIAIRTLLNYFMTQEITRFSNSGNSSEESKKTVSPCKAETEKEEVVH